MKYSKMNGHSKQFEFSLKESVAPCLTHCVSSPSKMFKCCCILVAGIFIVELLLFNILCIYGYLMLKDAIFPFINLSQDESLTDQLAQSSLFKGLVYAGKNGGFVSLMQETLERVYVTFPDNGKKSQNKFGSFGLDVSHSGEAIYVYRKILSRKSFPYTNLVVDVGANDGLIGSNSFNFIRWGWDAILIEPQHVQLELAKNNLRRYYSRYSNNNQTIRFVEAVLGRKDEMVQFVRTHDIVSMESHVIKKSDMYDIIPGSDVSLVQSLSVKTFVSKYKVPVYFGILSIDAEGQGNVILHSFIDLGFRPAYIIYEAEHEGYMEPPVETFRYLADHGYQYLCMRGWNHILEHQMEED